MDAVSGAFIASLGANVAGNVISVLSGKLKDAFVTPAKQNALERCVNAGLGFMLGKARTDDEAERGILDSIFRKFFSETAVASEIGKLLRGRPMDRDALTDVFDDVGYDPDTLPGLDIGAALAAFESAFLAAAVGEEPFQGTIQTEKLMALAAKADDILRELKTIAARGPAAPEVNLHLDQTIRQSVVAGINLILKIETGDHKPDIEPLREAYLNHVLANVGRVSLTGIDPKVASQAEASLALGAVYTALLTQTPEPMDKQAGPEMLERAEGGQRRLSAVAQLNKHKRLVLLGDPGSGKSTFVNFAALCLAGEALGRKAANIARLTEPLPNEEGRGREKKEPEPQPWTHGALMPVRVVLRDFAARGLPEAGEKASAKHLWSFIAAELDAAELADFAGPLRETLRAHGGLLLLDGLDEVPEANRCREQIKAAVADFASSFPKCRILVTSRTYAYQRQQWRLPYFTEAVLAPFEDGQIRRFVERWYVHIGEVRNMNRDDATGRAGRLKEAIFGSSRLRELAERPILLTQMASLHAWRGGTLPEQREELYADTVDLLLDWWETDKVVHDARGEVLTQLPSLVQWLKVDRSEVRRLLNELAYRAHASQPLDEEETTADVPQEWLVTGLLALSTNPDVAQQRLIEHLRDRAGLLLPRGEGVFSFPHRTIQEYLAACYFTEQCDYPGRIAGLARDEPNRWREVALLAAAKAARGMSASIWMLVDELCPSVAERHRPQRKADAWGTVIAGTALTETANAHDISEANRDKKQRVRRELVRVMHGSAGLPAVERVGAGNTLARLGDPRESVTTLDKMEFCLVPAGPFWMGEDEHGDFAQHLNECLTYDYWLARYPVTVAQWGEYVEASGNRPGDGDSLEGMPSHPVIWVSWHEARQFCQWLTDDWNQKGVLPDGWAVRLPSEAEWEKAARGGLRIPRKPVIRPPGWLAETAELIQNPLEKRRYPWGDTPNADLANCRETEIGTTSPVGCFTGGASPYGCEEIAGNVWEWTRSLWGKDWSKRDHKYPYDPTDEREDETAGDTIKRILCGPAYYWDRVSVGCSARDGSGPDPRYNLVGFRILLSPFPLTSAPSDL